ncbi:MAG: XdhC family protein [Eubacteriales bacterium]|nr:XdhC family protein [Eubacteriales bacterium]MDY3332738.1 XdhC family protein [Gallibacter sp.]
MKKLFEILKNELDANRDVTMVTVTASSGSTPRGAGARMIVGDSGRLYGTIGGGAVEFECQKRAAEVLKTKKSFNENFILKPNQVQDLGMICGGDVRCYFQFISAEDKAMCAIIDYANKLFEQDVDTWLITDITEDSDAGMALYSKNEGIFGIDIPEDIIYKLQSKPIKVTIEDRDYYVEQINQNGKVYIFGGGHVAQQLVPTLTRINFSCIVCEDREDFTKKELFEGVMDTRLVDMLNLDDICAEITSNDYICVMTRGHKDDYEVQRQVLRTPARYIGVIGSKRKIAGVRAKLIADGYNDKDLDRITAPIGIPLDAETPAEIAISVAGQLINERAKDR